MLSKKTTKKFQMDLKISNNTVKQLMYQNKNIRKLEKYLKLNVNFD